MPSNRAINELAVSVGRVIAAELVGFAIGTAIRRVTIGKRATGSRANGIPVFVRPHWRRAPATPPSATRDISQEVEEFLRKRDRSN